MDQRKGRAMPASDKPGKTERAAADHWRETADGRIELMAARCRACGTHHLPRVPVCASCSAEDLEAVPLGGAGRLYAYTIIRIPPPGYAGEYAVGYVDFPEGVRVFGQIRLDPDTQLASDVPVTIEKAVLFHRPDGAPVAGYRFVPSVQEAAR
jgi:hypothetical protein